MILGAFVIVVAGVLLINYFSSRKGEIVPPLEIEGELTEGTTHVVQEGEDLWKISEQYYGTGFEWSKIAQANNITDPNQIRSGQTLIIPGTASAEIAQDQPTKEEKSPTPTQSEEVVMTTVGSQHTVAKGETLWVIAEKYYKSGYNWVDIAKENNLENPGIINEGQKLNIPSVEFKLATVVDSPKSLSEAEAISGGSYTVKQGDSLWKIAVRAYGDGYRWSDIAKENNLLNPALIHPGNSFKLPR
ncbi:hypothetical protein A2715_05700 [Candidatus Woesebacteria bacterium RIFCSPHIGHO2_01_FULL_39_32]|uniref:LysM domain-containing protein n=1 Tax=Candidatus Woesebacteria bacterium RIFCSPLOWO2_01_FULL_39_25 TaxID=1802521 RepID=A0A1F8BLX7_9BACT|nr:MAG: hypothetical protein A2124_04145 [Candidatus Woesebacteria bacterium GWB1_37_5]OGM25512.1 MAG: hypothetical protein A2715_05700 [Candidatus Woesebacteria bacterium RIFCSPHIGHO2_01_FULL_39_32]OGM36792.1 MAG: hypothetical protein A3F01_00170 [Candidatus Woesebacteria bacterium RIFCSPHIGHO2_12_FULL_38_11]OGM65043.1 MAG: hypothetical protein A2893_05310 [Candidatus Woesebacteria bacterium RIFCSPLOWO2_01_FULL_39_25]